MFFQRIDPDFFFLRQQAWLDTSTTDCVETPKEGARQGAKDAKEERQDACLGVLPLRPLRLGAQLFGCAQHGPVKIVAEVLSPGIALTMTFRFELLAFVFRGKLA
jgi:hypothetical protein